MLMCAALAARKAGKWSSVACMLAIVMCDFPLHLQSRRESRRIDREVQSLDFVDSPATTTILEDEDDKLLACVVVDPQTPDDTKKQIVIPSKDKAFWDYYYTKGNYHYSQVTPVDSEVEYRRVKARSLNCNTYTPPPKPSDTLRNVTHPTLPDDMIGIIASFADAPLHCNPCELVNFNMKFLENCSAPSNVEQFLKVQKEVVEQGGDCEVDVQLYRERTLTALLGHGSKARGSTLQSCMELNSHEHVVRSHNHQFNFIRERKFAACGIVSERNTQMLISLRERTILGLQTALDLLNLESGSEQPFFIKRSEDQIRGYQKVIDSQEQDLVYAKHIFEGL